jgi:outer membrane lipoprotein-sorting protein
MLARLAGAVAASALLAVSAHASVAASARQIVERSSRNYDLVSDYTVNARLTVKAPNIHMPETNVVIYFKKPDKVHMECKEGFAMNAALMKSPDTMKSC